jgi:DNA-binding MarR family transcriptional regulator
VVVDEWQTAVSVLRLASQLVDGIQSGLARQGFDDVRPAHGFTFVRISAGGATTARVAEHLGVTKQAAAQLVAYLVEHGYIERRSDPADARARLLVLTDRGRACTAAAEQAAAETVANWQSRLTPPAFEQLKEALGELADPGQLRPAW